MNMTEKDFIELMKDFGCSRYDECSNDYGLFVSDNKIEWLFTYRKETGCCRSDEDSWEPGSFCVYDIDKNSKVPNYRRIQNRHTTDIKIAKKYIAEVISEIKLLKMKKLIKNMEKDFE